MRRLLLLCFLLPCVAPLRADGPFHPSNVDVFFSPKGGCTEAVVAELEKAKKLVLVQAYSFTSSPIATALVAAKKRGVDVRAVLDKSQRSEKYSSADFVAHGGIPTFIDGGVVLTGSFNFTKAAESSNAENLLVIRDSKLAERYTQNWKLHQEHAEPYAGR